MKVDILQTLNNWLVKPVSPQEEAKQVDADTAAPARKLPQATIIKPQAAVEDVVTLSPAASAMRAQEAQDPLAAAAKILQEAQGTVFKIADLMNELKDTLIPLADENLSAQNRQEYEDKYNSIVKNISVALNSTGKNVSRLLMSDEGITIAATEFHSEIKIPGFNLGQSLISELGSAPATAAGAIELLIGGFTRSLHRTGYTATTIDNNSQRIEAQITFEKSIKAAVTPDEVKRKEMFGPNGLTLMGSDYKSALNVGITVTDNIDNLLKNMKGSLSILSEPNLSVEARQQYEQQYSLQLTQLEDFINGSKKPDMNLLQNSNKIDLIYNKSGANISIKSFDLNAILLGQLPRPPIALESASNILQNILPDAQTQLQNIRAEFVQARDTIQRSIRGGGGGGIIRP